ncbi:MAG: hypothetical protein ACRDVM_01190, partial [Acidimicrobiia bacterium]
MVWLALAGLGLMLPVRRQVPLPGLCVMAFPIGLAAYVLASLVMLVSGVGFSPIRALLMASVAAAGVALWALRRPPRPHLGEALGPLAAIGTVAVLALLAEWVNPVQITPDSLRYLIMASVLDQTGGLEGVRTADLVARQVAIALFHTPSSLVGQDYLPSVTPVLGVTTLACLAWLGDRAMSEVGAPRRRRLLLVALALAMLISSNRAPYHMLYVNGHLAFATYLLIAAGTVWIAARRQEWGWVLPAAVSLAVLVPIRPESSVVAALFLVPVLVSFSIPHRVRWAVLGPYLLVVLGWFGLTLLPRLAAEGGRVST